MAQDSTIIQPTLKERMQAHDLGLPYEAAMHGVQTAIRFKINNAMQDVSQPDSNHLCGPKHMRVAIDMRKADHTALVAILVDKGIFTMDEYMEYLRLSANEEVWLYEQRLKEEMGINVSCR